MKPIIDPYGSELIADYQKLITDFGLEPFPANAFPNPNRLMRRNIIFAGRGLDAIAKAIREHKPYYVLTGIMPTAEKIHLGTKMVIEQVKYYQDHGAETYVLVADLEAAAAREVTLDEAKNRALAFHIPAYIALGLNPKKTTFYFQSENKQVMHLAYEFSHKITLNEFRAVYGNADPARILSALTQAGDILYPQLAKRMPGIIPTGPDQDPHLRLARDIVRRSRDRKFIMPSSSYHKFMPALNGAMKMSKSHPESYVELPEEASSIKKKINRALTGGRDTLEEHKRLGAAIEKDMVFELLKFHLIEDDQELQRIHGSYKAGTMASGEIKRIAIERLTAFMADFEKKLDAARKLVDRLGFVRFT